MALERDTLLPRETSAFERIKRSIGTSGSAICIFLKLGLTLQMTTRAEQTLTCLEKKLGTDAYFGGNR